MPRSPFPASKRLKRRFFARPALDLAQDLVGCALVWKGTGSELAVRIVEVEAYRGQADPASHAYRGKTRRNAQMFETPGHLYVYFTYGMHHCMNVVAERVGIAGAVLLRAAEPLVGEALMEKRRGRGGREVANGPAKLCQAFDIDRRHNGFDLISGPLGLWPLRAPERLAVSGRIGIREARDRPYRFFDADSPYVSKGDFRKDR